LKNINKYLDLVKNSHDGIDTFFTDDDVQSPYGAGGRKITLDKIFHGPPYVDISQTKRVIILLWEFGGVSMWGTTQIKDKRERWTHFIYFAEFGKIVRFKPGEEITLAKIFGLPDCIEISELTMGINGQLEIILLLI
jgi:hypothetical protein